MQEPILNITNLKDKRKENCYKQKYIAKELKISNKMYSAMERGERGISLTRAKMLADIFGVSIEELFFT